MHTVIIDILNEKALQVLKSLEQIHLIRFRKDKPGKERTAEYWKKYKGSMSKQPAPEIEKQLRELRGEWE